MKAPFQTRIVNQEHYYILERMTEISEGLNDLDDAKVVAFIINQSLVFAKPDGSWHMTMDYCK